MASDEANRNKLQKISKELTCSICTYILDDPNALHCGHSFCGICIHEWLENSKTCPLCRVQIVRQPVHVTTLQELADLLRPTPSSRKRLIRENWVRLFPIENNITFIVDEDEDGIVHRCSQCSWELTEENYCVRCEIQYDGVVPIQGNSVQNESDIDSDMNEPESNLEGFVVSDDEVEYDSDQPTLTIRSYGANRVIAIDDSDIESISDNYSAASNLHSEDTIEISDEDDTPLALKSSRKRRIRFISDDESDDMTPIDSMNGFSDDDDNGRNTNSDEANSDEAKSDEEIEYRNTTPASRYTHETQFTSDEMESEYDQDEIPEDPFSRPSSSFRFIDDIAMENDGEDDDDDDQYDTPRKPQKVDQFTENITRARRRMESNNSNNTTNNDSDSSDTDDDSDAPDYEFMSTPLTSNAITPVNAAASVPPQPPTEGEASSSTAAFNKSKGKGKKKKGKKNKNKSKRDKKRHKGEHE